MRRLIGTKEKNMDNITWPDFKKFKCREYRPGRWQVYFSHEGKQVFLQKMEDRSPLKNKSDCFVLITHLTRDGYDPKKWNQDKTFHFDVAVNRWADLSGCSPEWLHERKRLSEKLFIPFFGKKDIREIKTIHIDDFQKSLQDRGLSLKYIKNVLGELKAFFRFNRKSIPELPDFRKIEVQPSDIKWLSEGEQDIILEFLPKRHLPIFTFLRFYGCRLNEACGLLWENVFLRHSPPYVVISHVVGRKGDLKPFTKTKRLKILPIVPETEWLFQSDNPGTLVFSRNGTPYTSKSLNRIWQRASKKAHKEHGVPIVNVYNSMRHSWGCQRLNQGFSLDQVSTVMGHTSTQMTKRYAQYTLDKLVDVIRGKRKDVHKEFITFENRKLLNFQSNMVGGTGIEPATSGL